MIAIIETGGKQYKVSAGQKIKVEKLNLEKGSRVIFDKVLLVADDKNIEIGQPYLENRKVEGTLLESKKNKKVIVFRYHSKTRYRKTKGHRQWLDVVEINKI
jgi:large subunit ribosomal protein L21